MADRRRAKTEPAEEWMGHLLSELKKERRGVIWSTVLGSSVIAAVIGIGSSFLLERYKSGLSISERTYQNELLEDLERYKAELAERSGRAKERREAYSALAAGVGGLGEKLRVCVTLYSDDPDGRVARTNKDADDAVDSLTDQMGDVLDANNSRHIDGRTHQRVGDVLDSLGRRVSEVQRGSKGPHSLIDLYESRLKREIEVLKRDIEGAADSPPPGDTESSRGSFPTGAGSPPPR